MATAYAKTKKRLKARILRVKKHLMHYNNPVMNSDEDGVMTTAHTGFGPTISREDLELKLDKLTAELDTLIVQKGESTVRSAG